MQGKEETTRFKGERVLVCINVKGANGAYQNAGTKYFTRVPSVGEEFIMDMGSDLYVVEKVTHVLFETGDSDAEVFAKPIR